MAGYDLWLGNILFPVAPESINIQINGRNKTYDLINDGEMNVLKLAGLSVVSFTVLLPAAHYPFAKYQSGFKAPGFYLNELERMKQSRQPFQFIISRHANKGVWTNLYNTNMTVSLEDYSVKEDAKQSGFDTKVEIKLKQFKEFKTETFTVTTPAPTAPLALEPARSESTAVTGGNRGGGSGGGGGTKKQKYKVQIPGMGVVEVWATSVQDAISKAGASSWTGTIYVDGNTYYVNKGTLAVDPATIRKAASNAKTTVNVKAAINAVVTPAMITGAATGLQKLQTAATNTVNNILTRDVRKKN